MSPLIFAFVQYAWTIPQTHSSPVSLTTQTLVLRLSLFQMMVNFLKGYHIFIRPPDSPSGEEDGDDAAAAAAAGGSAAATAAVGRSSGGGGGGRAGQGQESEVEFDVLGFLSFAKADLRPFLRVLLRTKAFGAFLADARWARHLVECAIWFLIIWGMHVE